MAASLLLEVRGIVAGYGKVPVLHGVSLGVEAGEIVSVIGPNGAGKSTVLKTIMGYLRPSEGSVHFGGEDITGREVPRVVAGGLAYVPQGRVVFPRMSVLENLEMGAYLIRDARQVLEGLDIVFGLFPRLAERRRQRAGTMSGGEQQMLAIGRAIMTRPRCVLMDEPSIGLSPKYVEVIFEKIREMRSQGLTLLLVEQNATRALAASDRGYVLELGRNWTDGSGASLLANDDVRRMFVGG